jgi:excisionase family DNA binding protein
MTTSSITERRLPPFCTVREAAALLRVNRKTVYSAVDAGKLRHARVGRKILIRATRSPARLPPARDHRRHAPAGHQVMRAGSYALAISAFTSLHSKQMKTEMRPASAMQMSSLMESSCP